jgi:alpha-L-fucosidase
MARSDASMHPRLAHRSTPTWWLDAKLGIFIHWTPASVPAYAPTDADSGELLAQGRRDAMGWSPYTEWYENSLRFPDSPASQWHREHHRGETYADFVQQFEAALDGWDPEAWAAQFAATGARYVVLVAKHHDGWCLWPTDVPNPHRPGWHSERDIVGELAEAVRARGMRFGLYYSGGLDWTFDDRPIGTFSDMVAAVPDGDYPVYASAHIAELVERYEPSVLWNDIAWPGDLASLRAVLTHYYDHVPDGVVNDRWMHRSLAWRVLDARLGRWALDQGVAMATRRSGDGGLVPPTPKYWDVRTPEYTTFDDIRSEPWECVRGIDRSFGYNRTSVDSHHLSRTELLAMTTDIASKGGNLLLNVGPRGEDATIPDLQRERLAWLVDWETSFGAGLHDTRPWVWPGGSLPSGEQVRFTARGRTVFAAIVGERASTSVTIPGVQSTTTTSVTLPDGTKLDWRTSGSGLTVDLPDTTQPGCVIALHDVTAGPAPA